MTDAYTPFQERRKAVNKPGSSRRTLVKVVLDKSASMGVVRRETIDGVNRYMNGLVEDQRNTGETFLLSISYFDTYVSRPLQFTNVSETRNLNESNYLPSGSTALLDAIAQGIMDVEREMRSGDRAVVVIVTDGEENASREYRDANVIRDMIKEREARGNMTFVFLNAGPDQLLSNTLGFNWNNTIVFNNNPLEVAQSYGRLRTATAAYAVSGDMASQNFFGGTDTETESTDSHDLDTRIGGTSTGRFSVSGPNKSNTPRSFDPTK